MFPDCFIVFKGFSWSSSCVSEAISNGIGGGGGGGGPDAELLVEICRFGGIAGLTPGGGGLLIGRLIAGFSTSLLFSFSPV